MTRNVSSWVVVEVSSDVDGDDLDENEDICSNLEATIDMLDHNATSINAEG